MELRTFSEDGVISILLLRNRWGLFSLEIALVLPECITFPYLHNSPLRWVGQANPLHCTDQTIRRLAKWLPVSKAVMPELNAEVQHFNVFMQKHQKGV